MSVTRALLAILIALPCLAVTEARRGAVVDGFKSAADPSQTYALYLPTNYRNDRTWPLLLVFDPRSRGEFAAKLFAPAAEKYGWLVASSNNTMSDVATIEANRRAVHATLSDVASKYPIDAKRIYAAGFSGGARVAVDFALAARTPPAGVVLVGGGFAIGTRPDSNTRFAVFGMAGDTDFNYYEMRQLDRDLAEANVRRALRIFEGGHQWPPSELAGEAIEWLEIAAMARGLRAVDQAVLDDGFERRIRAAQEAEAGGRLVEAYGMYESIARDFDGLLDVRPVQQNAKRLGELRDVRSTLKRQDDMDQSDLAWRRRSMSTLQAALGPENPRVPSLHEIARALDLKKLKERAASDSLDLEVLSARRRLEMLFVQTSFYMFNEAVQKKLYDKALLSVAIAAEIKPDSPFVLYNLAAMNARTGKKDRALESLQRAVDAGFRNSELLRSDADLDTIREDPRFQQILASIPAQ